MNIQDRLKAHDDKFVSIYTVVDELAQVQCIEKIAAARFILKGVVNKLRPYFLEEDSDEYYAVPAGDHHGIIASMIPRKFGPGESEEYDLHGVSGWMKNEVAVILDHYGYAIPSCPLPPAPRQPEPLPRKSAETKSRDTLLVIIAGLAKKAGIDCDSRGAAKQIQGFVEETGAAIGDDVIRNVLKEIPEAIDRRTK